MKKALLIITALMLIVGCSSEPIDGSTLVSKDGLQYAPDSDKPYSGEVVVYYKSWGFGQDQLYTEFETGQKQTEGTYKDGERVGKWTGWHKNGQKEYEVTFKDGKKDGLATWWYENGQKKGEYHHHDGERVGKWTEWWPNGQKEVEATYKNGKRISLECWDEDGNEIDCDELEE